jgi:peptidoglycan/LPS O-acetylase OafA/YrhL
MRRFLRTAAITLSALMLFAVAAALISYHMVITKPGQGGWTLARLHEIAPLALPFLLLGLSSFFVSIKGARHAFSPAALTVFALSGFFTVILSVAAIPRIPQAGMLLGIVVVTLVTVVLSLFFGGGKVSRA